MIIRQYLKLHISWCGGLAVATRCIVIGLARLMMALMVTSMMSMRMLDVYAEELVRIHQVQRQELKKTFVTIESDD